MRMDAARVNRFACDGDQVGVLAPVRGSTNPACGTPRSDAGTTRSHSGITQTNRRIPLLVRRNARPTVATGLPEHPLAPAVLPSKFRLMPLDCPLARTAPQTEHGRFPEPSFDVLVEAHEQSPPKPEFRPVKYLMLIKHSENHR